MFEGSTRITTLCKKSSHVLRFNQEVIVVAAKLMGELAVMDTTLAVVRKKRREMEAVVSIC